MLEQQLQSTQEETGSLLRELTNNVVANTPSASEKVISKNSGSA